MSSETIATACRLLAHLGLVRETTGHVSARVDNETMSSEDVTQEYVDLEAQVRNLEATEQQYLRFLGRAVQLNFGTSQTTGRPVTTEFLTRFPGTVELTLCRLPLARRTK